MTERTYQREREPYKGGDAGDIEQTDPGDDPIANLKSKCSDPACNQGIINRGGNGPRVCACLYRARVDRWLYEMQFEKPVESSPLDHVKTARLLIRGSTWATTTRHLARRLLSSGIAKTLNSPSPKTHQKVCVLRLSHIVDAVVKSRRKFAPYAGKVLIVRTTAGSARQREINADCFHEFLGFAEDKRIPLWLVDEPSERLGKDHRAWSADVGNAVKEMKFVEVEIEPPADLDLSLLDPIDHTPPQMPEPLARPAYVHPDPSVRFHDGNVPTSAVDAAGMRAARARGVGPARAAARLAPALEEPDDFDILDGV